MLIYLDFDGTVVEHEYPSIGKCNVGCFEIIHKLKEAGHEIIINTMRVEFDNLLLMEAIEYVQKNMKDISGQANPPMIDHTHYKYIPSKWNWEIHIKNQCVFIDDMCEGIPLKDGISVSRKMVDWHLIDLEFKAHGIY